MALAFFVWFLVFALIEYLIRSRLGLPFEWPEIRRYAFESAHAAGQAQYRSFEETGTQSRAGGYSYGGQHSQSHQRAQAQADAARAAQANAFAAAIQRS